MRLPQPPLLVITDRKQARAPLEDIAKAIFSAGCRWLLLREKDLPADARLALLCRLVAVGERYDASVMVSGDIAAVAQAGAAGVHLPQDGDLRAARAALGPSVLIGRSAHTGEAVAAALAAGASYVTLSPIFPSPSKPGYGPALGLHTLSRCARAGGLPIVALGGVDASTAAACRQAGAAGVAMMGAVMRSDDPAAIVGAVLSAMAERS